MATTRHKGGKASHTPANTEADDDAKIFSQKDVDVMVKVATLEATIAELRKASESQAKAFETTVTNIGKGMAMCNNQMPEHDGSRKLLLTYNSSRNLPPREARPKAPAGKKQLYCREMSKKIHVGKDDPKEGEAGCLLDTEFLKKFIKATKWNRSWQATTGATELGEKGAMACLGHYYEKHETQDVRDKFEMMAKNEKERYKQERASFFEKYGKKAGMRERKTKNKHRKKQKVRDDDDNEDDDDDKSEEDNSEEEEEENND